MYYIFNSNNNFVCCGDTEPDIDDLMTRGEFYIYCAANIENPFNIIIGKYGSVFEPADNPKTMDELNSEQRIYICGKRNKLLSESDWIINRHLEQKMLGINTTLSESYFQNILNYRQMLRDISLVDGFPFVDVPVFPLEV